MNIDNAQASGAIDNWIDFALCSGMDTNIFYPERNNMLYPEKGRNPNYEIKPAINVCKKCPVRIECLAHAVNTGESFGVWGGFSLRTRRKIENSYNIPITYENAKEAIKRHDHNV